MTEIPTPLTNAAAFAITHRAAPSDSFEKHAKQMERDRAELIEALRVMVIVAEEEMSHIRVFPELHKARSLLARMKP